MAKVEHIIPFIVKWESGVIMRKGESFENLFDRAKKSGISDDPDDLGGLTVVGVTYATYKQYCKRKGYPTPTTHRFLSLEYGQWLDILKTMYWDRWQADQIHCQAVANILVAWVWASGVYGIKIPQRILGVKVDGIVGNKTLSAINEYPDQRELFRKIKQERIDFIDRICNSRPENNRFKKGWLNRLNNLGFEE